MTIHRRGLIGAGALAAAGMAGTGAPANVIAAPDPAAAARYRPALARVGALMERHLTEHGLPGLTLGVADADGFNAVLTAGLADVAAKRPVAPDHLFQIGSISKSFAGICALRLTERGRISFDTEARTLLPEVGLPDGPPITLRHLLNHTSGLPSSAPVYPRADGGRLLTGFPPGQRFSYSNLGYNLLGLMLAEAAGKPYPELVEEAVFQPLGMTASAPALRSVDRTRHAVGYAPLRKDRPFMRGAALAVGPWFDLTEAAANVTATPGDMALYLRWLIGVGRGRGGPVLSDASAGLLLDASVAAPDRGDDARYGLGLTVMTVDGRRFVQHGGGMPCFSSSLLVDPEGGVGAFASGNVGRVGYRPRDIVLAACRELHAARTGKAPIRSRAETPPDPAPYTGSYADAAGARLELRRDGSALRLMFEGREAAVEIDGADSLLTDHPALAHAGLTVERKDGAPAIIWSGSRQFARDPADLDRRPVPAALRLMEGRYDNDEPWESPVRVFARPDGLWLNGTTKLHPLPGGGYRTGEDAWSPERAEFGLFRKGRPQRLTWSGVDYIRRDL